MNQKFAILILFILLPVFISCKKEETQAVITNNPLKTELETNLHSIVTGYAGKKVTAGLSIGILQNGEVFQYGYGEIIKGLKTIPDENTVFEIGSITKTFTATMLIELLNKLDISLDEPINNLLPSDISLLIKNGKKITVKQLLNHSSGLPRLPEGFEKNSDPNDPYKNYDSLAVYQALKNVKLQSVPGEKFEYSNLGMAVAGLILERRSGKSYADYLNQNICIPLDMRRTKAENSYTENIARGYTEKGRETSYWKLNGYSGAGTIYSSTGDLLKYAKAFISPDNTSKPALFKKVKELTFSNAEIKIASAWFLLTINGVECLVHDGGTGGFRSFIYLAPSTNTALVVLANNGTDDAARVANRLAELIIK
ncbi:serine hydrolase domain-containing protein [Desertivirga arenae]|uniref:serine hydrolase domain-containing protein n=1 Tax=Desertivirga arenae TaxID=2810309 RepID=UPI001A963CBB|nr:serine hydrolase domain-containing protein [Pedobacter sp. SYSU D00823]